MLRITGLSLLLGFAILVAIITRFYAPTPGSKADVPPLIWPENSEDASDASDASTSSAEGHLVTFNKSGLVAISLDTRDVNVTDYAFLHLAIEDPPENLSTGITLRLRKSGRKSGRLYDLPNRSPTSFWLAVEELEGWNKKIGKITLSFWGKPGNTLHIREFALLPSTPWRQLRAIYSDLTSNTPWRRADMNTHTGVSKTSSFYPVPLAVSLVILSIFAYTSVLLVLRRQDLFNWKAIGLVFLACWIALDLVWQNRLLYQVTYSQRVFAGKTTPEKLAAGPDGRLYSSIAEARKHIDSEGARVFVAARDDYTRMRGAYYFYPFNAFWKLEPPEVPADNLLLPGDYVAIVRPADTFVGYNKTDGTVLRAVFNPARPAEEVYSNSRLSLVRIK